MPESGPRLVLREARIGHRRDRVVADGLSLEIGPGEIAAVAGPSGAGKTTVLATAAGLLPLLGGELWRCGGALGMAFQEPRLLPWCTAEENVLFPLGRRPARGRRERARELLELLGLGDRCGTRPEALSGGMRRRVALARALAVDPVLLVADEPFAHLDDGWSDRVEELLARAAGDGAAVLLAAHQPERVARLATVTVPLSPRFGGTAR